MYQTLFSVRLTYPSQKRYRYYEDKEPCLYACASSLLLASMAGMAKEVKIGMAIVTIWCLERWQKDRDIFVNKAESLGAKVFVQSANGTKKRRCRKLKT